MIETKLPGVNIIEPKVFSDACGWFMEAYSTQMIPDTVFVQDNHSYTLQPGTLRGIHYQNDPLAQAKLVRVIHGAVADVAIDLRKGSPTYKQWICVELSAENKSMLFIPRGFGHAFLTLTPDVEFVYKVDNLFSLAHDRSIRYDDPTIGVDWGIKNPVISIKDMNAPLLTDSDCNFVYSEGI